MKYFLRTLSILCLSSLILVQCAKKEESIAEVGSFTISKSDIVELLKRKYPNQDSFTDVDVSVKKDLLEPLIVRKLYLNEGIEKGYDEDPEFKNGFGNFQMRIIGSKYFESTVVDKIISKDMLDAALSKQGVELKASHILIANNKSPRVVNRTPEEALKRAREVEKRLKNGEDFAALVEEFSDDPSAASNKGDLGYFVWGKMVPEFFDAAWDLQVGQISEPVESSYGYHIIRLDDRRPVKDFKVNKTPENIYRTKQALMRTYRDSARVLWENQYEKLLSDADYQLYMENITQFADTLKSIIKEKPLTKELFSLALRDITFAKWDGDQITAGTFIDKYQANLPSIFSNFRDPAKLKQQVDRVTRDKIVLEDARRLGLDEEEMVTKELNAFKENQMERLVEAHEIRDSLQVSDEEIKAYYDKNSSLFVRPEEIEIWEIDVEDQGLAGQLAMRAKNGENFEALARKYCEDKQLQKKSGYLGYKNKTGRGSVSQTALEAGQGGKIAGPVKYGRYWAILKTGKLHKASVRPLEEVRRRIQSQIKNEKIKEAKLAFEKKLQETYKVTIDEEKLKAL